MSYLFNALLFIKAEANTSVSSLAKLSKLLNPVKFVASLDMKVEY